MKSLVEIALFAIEPVISKLVAVVGCEDDKGMIIGPARFQLFDQAAQLRVHGADQTVVGGPQLRVVFLA